MSSGDMYTDGEYLKHNPTWDIEDAPWKADLVHRMITRHHLEPKTICEIGCGSGEILRQLQMKMPVSVQFTGYEISPQAIELCRQRENERLHFRLKDFTREPDVTCDLILMIDLIEHLEDYFTFLRQVKDKSPFKILHIPLEIFVLALLHQQFLLGQRRKVGHLHFFTRDIALQVLQDLGYEIIDYEYTAGYALPRNYGLKDKLLKIPRCLSFFISRDFTIRVFGGYSLLVLVK